MRVPLCQGQAFIDCLPPANPEGSLPGRGTGTWNPALPVSLFLHPSRAGGLIRVWLHGPRQHQGLWGGAGGMQWLSALASIHGAPFPASFKAY